MRRQCSADHSVERAGVYDSLEAEQASGMLAVGTHLQRTKRCNVESVDHGFHVNAECRCFNTILILIRLDVTVA